MGEWIYRDANNHRCRKPNGDSKTVAGDIWKCDCGLMWRVTSCAYKGDQRDNWYEITWVEHKAPVPTQNAGGYAVNRLGGDSSGIYAPGTK